MADPLLTSLCTICRIESPRYKCPRCNAKTCSLSCVKKHKNWSSCNGERDPTTYVALDKLKTDAGIDHDYNFLTNIERSVERVERVLREDREILPQEGMEPPPNKRARFGKGQSRGRTTIDTGPRKWDKHAIQRIRGLGIHVSSVPYGMARSRENNTSWNRRTMTINWQVEWFYLNTDWSHNDSGEPPFERMLHKSLDETPLHVAFAEALEYDRHRRLTNRERWEEKREMKKHRLPGQRPQDVVKGSWQDSPSLMQDHDSGAWSTPTNMDIIHAAKFKYRFFYRNPKTPSREPQRLTPLATSDTFAGLLAGRAVVEFPTIWALPVGITDLGERYIIEDTGITNPSKKRKASILVEYESDVSLPEESGDTDTSDDTTSSSGSDTDMTD